MIEEKMYDLNGEIVVCTGSNRRLHDGKLIVKFIYPIKSEAGNAMITIRTPEENIIIEEDSLRFKDILNGTTTLDWEKTKDSIEYLRLLKIYNQAK
jgi:hypothetical protein